MERNAPKSTLLRTKFLSFSPSTANVAMSRVYSRSSTPTAILGAQSTIANLRPLESFHSPLTLSNNSLRPAWSSLLSFEAFLLRSSACVSSSSIPNAFSNSSTSSNSLTVSRNPFATAFSISVIARSRRRSPHTRMC